MPARPCRPPVPRRWSSWVRELVHVGAQGARAWKLVRGEGPFKKAVIGVDAEGAALRKVSYGQYEPFNGGGRRRDFDEPQLLAEERVARGEVHHHVPKGGYDPALGKFGDRADAWSCRTRAAERRARGGGEGRRGGEPRGPRGHSAEGRGVPGEGARGTSSTKSRGKIGETRRRRCLVIDDDGNQTRAGPRAARRDRRDTSRYMAALAEQEEHAGR